MFRRILLALLVTAGAARAQGILGTENMPWARQVQVSTNPFVNITPSAADLQTILQWVDGNVLFAPVTNLFYPANNPSNFASVSVVTNLIATTGNPSNYLTAAGVLAIAYPVGNPSNFQSGAEVASYSYPRVDNPAPFVGFQVADTNLVIATNFTPGDIYYTLNVGGSYQTAYQGFSRFLNGHLRRFSFDPGVYSVPEDIVLLQGFTCGSLAIGPSNATIIDIFPTALTTNHSVTLFGYQANPAVSNWTFAGTFGAAYLGSTPLDVYAMTFVQSNTVAPQTSMVARIYGPGDVEFRNCYFRGDPSGTIGYGLQVLRGANVYLENCVFDNVDTAVSLQYGGTVTFSGCGWTNVRPRVAASVFNGGVVFFADENSTNIGTNMFSVLGSGLCVTNGGKILP